jgi:hypothetical protein
MFIVIETLGGPEYATICTNEDGDNAVFETEEEATRFASSECHEGVVVEL